MTPSSDPPADHPPSAASLIAAYARRFHGHISAPHYVSSPAGAWLLLALASHAAPERLRGELEKVLGTNIPSALAAASALLADPPSALAAASAVWSDPKVRSKLTSFFAGLPAGTESGPVPSQDGADAWAREHSAGLIDSFPVALDRGTVLVLATALASKISWDEPFHLDDADVLGENPWARELTRVLRADGAHEQEIFEDPDAGLVAAHGAYGSGLLVVSVIGERSVAPARVLAAAHRIGGGWARGCDGDALLAPVSLFDLPLGEGPAWTLVEEQGQVSDPSGRESRITTALPAWRASSQLDLAVPGLGLDLAAEGLISQLPPFADGYEFEARQRAVAAYTRDGFEAAAVSAMSLRFGAAAPHTTPGLRRTARVAFGHPYAVVAVVPSATWDVDARQLGASPWAAVPVFSAWIGTPADAD